MKQKKEPEYCWLLMALRVSGNDRVYAGPHETRNYPDFTSLGEMPKGRYHAITWEVGTERFGFESRVEFT